MELAPCFDEAYYNRGNVYLALGRTDEAVANYTQSIVLNPKKEGRYFKRGNARTI